MENGWIKLHRKILSWEWKNEPKTAWLFVYLLLSANHEDSRWRGIDIKRGQLVTGLYSLSEGTGISIQSLRTCLQRLVDSQIITSKSTNKFRIITIIKWEQYQARDIKSTSDLTSNQQTTNKQSTTNKKNKNIKNDKNKTSNEQVVAGLIEVFNVFSKINPSIKRMYGNKTQRKSAENLIKQFGADKVLRGAEAAIACLGQPYAPRITTPYMLEIKWAELVAFYQEHKNKQLQKGGVVL